MSTWNTILVPEKLEKAIEQLEMLAQPQHLRLLHKLKEEPHLHLPDLSQDLKASPFKLKIQLDALKHTGMVFSPQRYPKAYALNHYRWTRMKLSTQQLAKDTQLG